MSFIKWRRNYEKAFHDSLLEYSKVHGLKMKRGVGLIPSGLEEQTLQLYTAYRNQRTTNMLVWATWALAMSTILLSGLTIYFQYLRA